MIAYIDSSVLLRVVLAQPDRLMEWPQVQRPVTSALTEVECLRTLDRRFQQRLISESDLVDRRHLILQLLERMDRIELSPPILRRAAEPFPTALGTLDALHLATACLWGQEQPELPVMATHDLQLSTAARALGFTTLGC